MFGHRKPRKNYRKGTRAKQSFGFLRRLAIGFYLMAGIAGLMAASCLFILAYDGITQCDYFKAKVVKVGGLQRLSEKQVVQQARIEKGMNILAVNLSLTRKRLMAHPWIAEAEVRREIPSGLYIRIKEQSPLAIIDLGHKYIINEEGLVFKEWSPSDPATLPLVSGLKLEDIGVHRTASPALRANRLQNGRRRGMPFEAVMQVLILGKQAHSILPNRTIKQIRVDRQIGITLEAFSKVKTVVLGYHDYSLKYMILKNILAYRKQRQSFPDFNRIDLNNVNRIVVNPVSRIPAGDRKEV